MYNRLLDLLRLLLLQMLSRWRWRWGQHRAAHQVALPLTPLWWLQAWLLLQVETCRAGGSIAAGSWKLLSLQQGLRWLWGEWWLGLQMLLQLLVQLLVQLLQLLLQLLLLQPFLLQLLLWLLQLLLWLLPLTKASGGPC